MRCRGAKRPYPSGAGKAGGAVSSFVAQLRDNTLAQPCARNAAEEVSGTRWAPVPASPGPPAVRLPERALAGFGVSGVERWVHGPVSGSVA